MSHLAGLMPTLAPEGLETIIIDNASRDGTCNLLSQYECVVKINKVNHSFSKSNNEGVKLAQGDNLLFLNNKLKDLSSDIQFMSFSINPDFDTPSQLKRYKEHYQINAKNWDFLTGNEDETHRLGIENFQIFAGRDDEAEGGFAHSGAFTLVDKEGFVRGVYLGTDIKQVKQLEQDVRLLLKEEYGIVRSK
jgi:hypothetical protein